MRLSNLEILNVLQGLNLISQNKLPIRLAWKVTTAIRSLQDFAKAVDTPMQEIRLKYALRDENGNVIEAFDEKGEKLPNTIQLPTDKLTIVNAEMNELLEAQVEVSNVELLLSDFPESMELEPSTLNLLLPIIKNEPVQEQINI